MNVPVRDQLLYLGTYEALFLGTAELSARATDILQGWNRCRSARQAPLLHLLHDAPRESRGAQNEPRGVAEIDEVSNTR